MAKHHKSHKHTPAAASPEELEHKAKELLDAGKWRQARDAYKILCKQDRAKYLPGLIQANRGLAEELMQKGQISEAEQVLAHLRTIAPQEEFAGVALKGAMHSHDWEGAAKSAVEIWRHSGGALNEQNRQAVADALMLSFPELNGQSQTADWPEPLRTELAAVLGALRAVSEEQYDRAQDLLRPIPRASVFADWKTLIKGLIAFYTDAKEKAETLFAMLPPQSVAARASAPLRAIIDPKHLTGPRTPERDRTAVALCRLMGAPGVADLLAEADELWKAGKQVDSLNRMRLAAEFPSSSATLVGALSEFYYRALFTLRQGAFIKYFRALDRLSDNPKSKDERFLVRRILLIDSLRNPHDNPEDRARDLLVCFRGDPRLPKLTSLVLAAAAKQLADEEGPMDRSLSFGKDWRNVGRAIRLLEESVAADPENLEACLDLIEQYKFSKQKSERNRLLDEMTKRFPNEKRVLLQAGIECIERKALVKGLDYLEKARQLDPLDPAIGTWKATGQVRLAEQQYEKKQTEKARATFASLTSRPAGEKLDFIRNPEFLHARQGVLETLYGDKEKGEALISQARQEARSKTALLLFLHCIRLTTDKPGKWKETPYWKEFTKTVPRSPQERMDLLLTLGHFESAEDVDANWKKEENAVLQHLAPAAQKDFSPKEAGELALELLKRERGIKLAGQLVKQALKEDPNRPRLRIMDVLLEPVPPIHRIKELEEAIRDARNAGDFAVANAAEGPLETMRLYAGPNPFADTFDEDEDEDDFDYTGAGFDLPDELNERFEGLHEIREGASKLTDEEFAAFRKKAIRKMPAEMFDVLIGSVRKEKFPQPASGKDDVQPELF